MKTFSLIIAKGNSKRLKNKNLMDFCGKPMFLWNVLKCLAIFSKTFVSSDDMFILNTASKYGAIPIIRPKKLCGETPNISVYQHAYAYMDFPDAIVAVQSNSPTIKPGLIRKIKGLIESNHYREIMTCHEDHTIYGSIWAIKAGKLIFYDDPYSGNPDILLLDNSIDIHNQEDFKLALVQMKNEN